MFRLPNVDQKLQGIVQDKLEVLDDFSMAHFLKPENINQGKWKNVHCLTMKNSQVSDKSLQLLAQNPISSQIEQLEMQSNFSAITDNTLNIISNSPFLVNLQLLDLTDDSITDEGISYLASSRVSRNIQTLVLYGNVAITSESLKYIAQSKEWKSLMTLDLRSTYVSDVGFKEFCMSKNLSNLKNLNISMNVEAITDETMKYLSMSKYITQLEVLNVANCSITDEGIKAICNSANFQKLIDLDISNDNRDFDLNTITDASLDYLANTTYLTNLEKLNLRGLRVSSNGINMISISYNFMNLQTLRLSQCQGITDKALDALVTGYAKNIKNLQKLYVNETRVSEKGIRYIMKAIPAIDIVYDFRLYIGEEESDEKK